MSKGNRVRSGRSRAALLERRESKLAAFILRRKMAQQKAEKSERKAEQAGDVCPVATCKAAGDEPCRTKSGAPAKRRHKGRPQ